MTTPADHHPDHSAASNVERRTDDAAGDHGADPSGALRGRDEGFDLARLGEITDRDGFAVFDATAPGGVRAMNPTEQHALTGSIRSSQLGAEPGGADTGLHSESPYRPDAEWGDPDYREPASDAEAAARAAYVRAHFPATGWAPRANTEVEDALDDASERAVLSDRAHDPDPQAWAEYRRLLALDRLARLPAVDELGEVGEGADRDDRVLRDYLRDQAAFGGEGAPHNLAGRALDVAAADADLPRADPAAFGVEPRGRFGAGAGEYAADIESELRREQLARWHDDDHGGSARDGLDARHEPSDDAGDGAGWGR